VPGVEEFRARFEADLLRRKEELDERAKQLRAVSDYLEAEDKRVLKRAKDIEWREKEVARREAEPHYERCSGCGEFYDPHTCHCGDDKKSHSSEHSFVPMGCRCGGSDPGAATRMLLPSGASGTLPRVIGPEVLAHQLVESINGLGVYIKEMRMTTSLGTITHEFDVKFVIPGRVDGGDSSEYFLHAMKVLANRKLFP